MKKGKVVEGIFENPKEKQELIDWLIRKITNASDRHLKIIYNFIWGLLA